MNNANNTKNTGDILTQIAARDAAPAPVVLKPTKAYALVRGNGGGLATSRLYSYARARKVAARARRMGVDVYASAFGLVNARVRM